MSAYASQNPLISQGISGLVEHSGFEPLTSTMRMSRATNCANAPRWFSSLFLLCEEEFLLKKRKVVVVPGTRSKGESRTGRHFLNAGRLSESAGEQMSEAVIFLPNLAGGLGLGWGRKYAYLVLPTVLMPILCLTRRPLYIPQKICENSGRTISTRRVLHGTV